ncbi:SCAPER domain-containing protein short spindle 3 isoform X2 [Anticarsia gemmatalis]|uniref:SCAPER domain-containing protein short spindle 3 isoform X2 n=1 Tax=Anticarsia gemmatalis TaxID=129554 RepID=UPI003F7653D3
MEEVRQLVQEEGREARNLVAFHVAVDTPSRISRKPPRAGPPPRRAAPRAATRLRSASAGRDKRSELRARYWALLFGDLQRAIGEIYNTVEAHENLNECQEVILVLENYTRDFKALGEWFRLKWEYDNTPPPQRPQSLAWEIRKTDFVRPESRRTHSVKSSPSVSGKNSPCLSGHNTPSGKNSPNLTGKASPGSGKISPRISGHSNTTSPKANIEFFSSKIAAKITAKPEAKSAKEISRLSDIKEKEVNNIADDNDVTHDAVLPVDEKEISAASEETKPIKQPMVEIGKAKECPNASPKLVVIKSPKRSITPKDVVKPVSNDNISSQAKATIDKLDAMENEFLAKQLTENAAKNENQLNLDKEIESGIKSAILNETPEKIDEKLTIIDDKESTATESPVKSEDNFADVSNESSCKSPEIDEKITPKEESIVDEIIIEKVEVTSTPEIKEIEQNVSLESTDCKSESVESVVEERIDLNTSVVDSTSIYTSTDQSIDEKIPTPEPIDVTVVESIETRPCAEETIDEKARVESVDVKTCAGERIDEQTSQVPIDEIPSTEELIDAQTPVAEVIDSKLSVEQSIDEKSKVPELIHAKPKSKPSNESTDVKVPKGKDKKSSQAETNDAKPSLESNDKTTKESVDVKASVKSNKVKLSAVEWINVTKSVVETNGLKTDDAEDTNKAQLISEVPTELLKQEPLNGEKVIETKDSIVELKETPQSEVSAKKDVKSVTEKPQTRPAYSQAAAKPKPVTTPKPEPKTQARFIARSKTVVEIRPNSTQKAQKRNEPRNRSQTNKCSYPFNLTTGRTSLFDAPNKAVPKNVMPKPVNRMVNQQMGSGDNKNTLKVDVNTRKPPPRPTSLKINEKGDKKENNNAALGKIKDCDEYGSSDTIVTQIDLSRIESSESLKTLVPEEGDGGSIEVLNVDKTKSDDDGWLTVKSRRLSRESKKQSKSHWANRFHQPSATTSLPTLNMIESPKQEIKEIVSSTKLDRAKSEQPQNIPIKPISNEVTKMLEKPNIVEVPKSQEVSKPKEVPKVKETHKPQEVIKQQEQPKQATPKKEVSKPKSETKETKKDLAMIRQKSDVTGLKTRTSRSKALKKEKIKDTPKNNGSELTKNRLHSSLESLTTGLARSQESTQETFDFDKWKAEFKTTFKFLEDDDQMPNHNEILKSADPSEMSEIAEMTSQIEENERKISWALDFQSEVDQRKLCEEEDLLNRQIMELQQVSDIDLDTETDDTETDAEILCEDTSACTSQSTENLSSLTASLEDQYETALAGMSWAERIDTLGALEALVARDPGRAQQLHAKLSQGIKRRGSLQDALRRLQAKQARAERQRREYQTERARKIHQLLARVEEVKVAKNQLIEEKRLRMERRLQKAAENRDQHLKDIVRKAHDEEEKLREIAFIKQLEAENRRHEFLSQCRTHTTRLRIMRRDRLSKLEQKQAREAAVGARRQALEAARRLHVASLLERRKERDARVEELKGLKKQERDDAAREKVGYHVASWRRLHVASLLERRKERDARVEELKGLKKQERDDAAREKVGYHVASWRRLHVASLLERRKERDARVEELKGLKKQERDDAAREKVGYHVASWRRLHVASLLERRKERDARVEELKGLKKQERDDAAREKAEGVKSRLSALAAAAELEADALRSRIRDKQDASQQRLESHLQAIREKATGPRQATTSESQDQSAKEEKELEEEAERLEQERKEREKQKAIKKKARKIKQKLLSTNERVILDEQIKDNTPHDTRTCKVIHQIEHLLAPLVDPDNERTNGFDTEDTKKQNKKNKKLTNGDVEKKSESNNNKEIEKNQEEKNESKKRKKKNCDKDKPKLSKSGSVCSSLSDMSRGSGKGDKKGAVIDMPFLERQLNELHRMIEKFDKARGGPRARHPCTQHIMAAHLRPRWFENSLEKASLHKVHCVKTLGQFIAVAAEREDLVAQITVKSLITAVMIMSRAIGTCPMSAAYFISTNACVYVVKLLSNQLEKDLQSDQKEMDLAKQLSDCLSVGLDSVLCSSRLYEENKEAKTDEVELLTSLRTRSHTLISYICLCGCITRAEKAGEVRESIQTLLTVCADLCQPCDVDVGSERASATQSLRCALGTGVCGSRAEFCVLFSQGAVLEHSGGFVRAARTAHLLRALAELDHQIVQEAFGEGGWPIEFRAAVARLLSQHAPNDKEAPRTTALRLSNQRLDQSLSETMVLDLIVLVGFVVVNNPQLQETICEGWSVIKTLCTLPANWLVSRIHSHALLPTLVALSEHSAAAVAIASELSTGMLDEYMKSAEAQKVKLVQVIKQGRTKKGKK